MAESWGVGTSVPTPLAYRASARTVGTLTARAVNGVPTPRACVDLASSGLQLLCPVSGYYVDRLCVSG